MRTKTESTGDFYGAVMLWTLVVISVLMLGFVAAMTQRTTDPYVLCTLTVGGLTFFVTLCLSLGLLAQLQDETRSDTLAL